jgi:hypothetical protein
MRSFNGESSKAMYVNRYHLARLYW